MMRNYLKIICIVLCAVFIIPVLSACAKDGLSAYDIAVKNGFEGTEQEWLLSLKGTDAPDNSDAFKRAVNRGLLSSVFITTYSEYGTEDITSSKRKGVGSGFFYSIDRENGSAYIVTNYHVVYDGEARFPIAREMYVSFYGLEENQYAVPAVYIGGSATFDIAVLRIENCELLKTGPWQTAPVRSSSDIMLGETVFTVGNAKMLGISTAVGTVTQESLDKQIPRADGKGEVDMRLFRIDAPINHGNSGGAVFD
ncbi:MAG: trypsin-like peptidase domain-containing protein, partial [Clostridia bacterium]|nr:trypsin-like peptidase domain-containing protein [Clostridia bacterium]